MYSHRWVFWFIPIILAYEIYSYYRIRSNAAAMPQSDFLKAPTTWRIVLMRVARFLPAIAMILLLLALAGPQEVETATEILPSGIDIMVALDISGSMAAEDFQPNNRLAVAKDVLRDFIRGRPSDRIGLLLFSGRTLTRSPLTLQHSPLIAALQSVSLGTLPEGTAIGSAILSGINRLSTKQKSSGDRILLLITDGRNNAGEVHPLDALSIAVQEKIKIFTIGVGSYGNVPFPVIAENGKKTYRYEKADLDEALLQTIADRTGGKYFRASDPKSMQALFQQINQLVKSEPQTIETHSIVSKAEKFVLPAAFVAFGFLIVTTMIVRYP